MGVKMFAYEFEQIERSKAWDIWLVQYANMDKTNFVNFEDFYESLKPKEISKKSAEEILEQARKIQESIKNH